MKILVLHRKKSLKFIHKEIMAADEIWIIGRITPEMRKSMRFAELVNKILYFSPLKQETEDRLFGK